MGASGMAAPGAEGRGTAAGEAPAGRGKGWGTAPVDAHPVVRRNAPRTSMMTVPALDMDPHELSAGHDHDLDDAPKPLETILLRPIYP
jgi:hypothetical protein